jgi:hypothetical protein
MEFMARRPTPYPLTPTLSPWERGPLSVLLPREGALLTSHGETIAGLVGLLKDGAERRRARPAEGRSLTNPNSPARSSLQEM